MANFNEVIEAISELSFPLTIVVLIALLIIIVAKAVGIL